MKKFFIIIVLTVVSTVLRAQKQYDIAAFVWPSFHHEPRAKIFWPDGIGEWQSMMTNTSKFPGHEQPRIPLWGYVNEADPYVMEKRGMKAGTIALLLPSMINALAQGTIDPDNKKVWRLVWKDDFNYKKRSDLLKVWESQNGGDPRPTVLCSRWEENIEVGNGVVRLVNRKESRGGKDWTSGNIWTKRDFQYGYFECRYKYATETGTNNSFWIMTRLNDPAPKIGKRFEIDINEGHYPDRVNTAIHNWTDITVDSNGKSTHPSWGKSFHYENIDFSKEYHLFGLEWTEDELIFYLDRKEIRREKNLFCLSPSPVWLSLAILSWQDVTDKIDGTYMEIDYVRVYNRK